MRLKNILLVDDSEDDTVLFERYVKKSDIEAKLHCVCNGVEALDFMYKRGGYEDAPDIDIAFIDINMPMVDGFEGLKVVKEDEKLKSMVVIMLSGSSSPDDIKKSYEMFASCYLTKDIISKHTKQFFDLIGMFWFHQVPCRI